MTRYLNRRDAMRKLALAYIGFGLLFLAFILAVPGIMRWQAINVLGEYGALEHVDVVVNTSLGQMMPDLVATAIASSLVAFSGALILLRRKSGFYIVCAVGAVKIAMSSVALGIAMYGSGSGLITSFLSLWIWVPLLTATVRRNKEHGEEWWNRAPHCQPSDLNT